MLRRHPWIFSGAVAGITGKIEPGETARVLSSDGKPLALAAVNPGGRIAGRIWTWNTQDRVDDDFIRNRIHSAIDKRRRQPDRELPAAGRLIHAESDGLPGLIVDWYNGVLAVQFLAWSAEAWRSVILDVLASELQPLSVYERSDTGARQREGLEPQRGLLQGAEPGLVKIQEFDRKYLVDIAGGQKTGFYLDQCQNREEVRGLASNRRVLDVFSYTSAFGVAAIAGGASELLSVESSEEAIELARQNLTLNRLDTAPARWSAGDAFRVLRELRDRDAQFDLVILDPPKFAPTVRQVHRASRGYKDLNLLAFKLLAPGGILVTFSCSGGVAPELFQKIVADAALDAGRTATIQQRLAQPADHPVALHFPESAYLKGLVCLTD